MADRFIKSQEIYGHPDDPNFSTTSKREHDLYRLVHELIPVIEAEIRASGRFSVKGTMDGAVRRHIDMQMKTLPKLLELIHSTPVDYFGMDKPDPLLLNGTGVVSITSDISPNTQAAT
jgi:hypothetical protein